MRATILAALISSSAHSARASTMTQASRIASSAAAIAGLQPAALWTHFAEIAAIPRVSKHEGAILQHLKDIAAAKGLPWKQDAAGNLCVFAPGRGKGASAPPVIIQGHVDMVTEKNQATEHDFLKDPISLARSADGKWLTAEGTTLGADNGIGVAAALALLDEPDPVDLPPLQLLMTVDEETGLNGAKDLDPEALGLSARTLLNLDTEEWSQIYIGCAGGGDARIAIPVDRATPNGADGAERVAIRVEGLLGGHSGINIHEGRGNAVQLAVRAAHLAMLAAEAAGSAAYLCALDGGDKHNAIPREATATLLVPEGARAAVEASVAQSAAALREEYGLLETKATMSLRTSPTECSGPTDGAAPLTSDSARRLLDVILALPHGPLKMSHAVEGLVETSNNVASVATPGPGADGAEQVHLLCSTRSSVMPALDAARDKLRAIATTMGRGEIHLPPSYPGWNPDPSSKVLGLTKEVLSQLLAEEGAPGEPRVLAIHAGLECGLIGEKCASAGYPLDMVSFGPTITGAHSPDERVEVDTVPKFYELTKRVLARLAEARV
mmetsp:Transcript_9352/g.27239  ORF Transcript_9352/g.27239 Transcript_9352/m.27239 type:complete len:554 (+) Transcript_9352:20-1681(+)